MGGGLGASYCEIREGRRWIILWDEGSRCQYCGRKEVSADIVREG